MPSASSIINQDANYTAQTKAAEPKKTGSAGATLTSSQFMDLMLKQIQFQDPMAPTDNAQMVTQQAQFSQLSATTEMNDAMKQNNSIMQTLTLVGKDVTLTNPKDATKTITGTVSSAQFNSTGAAIEVNGTTYPISLVQKVTEHSASTSTSTTNTASK